MAKRLVIKTGEYQKDGATKGEYMKLGVVLSNDNGSYVLLDPSVNLAGALIKQNVLAEKQGKPARDMLMVSIFEDDNQRQQPQQSSQAQQQGYKGQQAPQNNAPVDDFNDPIPF